MPEGNARPLPRPLPIAAVLFDLDGTLADSAGDLAAALNAVRADHGLPALAVDALRPHASAGARGLLGVGMNVAPDHPGYRGLRDAFLAHYIAALDVTTRLFDGVPAMLDAIEARGLAWGIVTNKVERYTTPVVAALGLSPRAGVVVSGDTTAHPKPHPLPLLHAAQALGVAPRDCAYVGDDERDIIAARAAGMPAVVALWGYRPGDDDPATWQGDALAETPRELLDPATWPR
jgi:phosphoglycolate phosphatase